MSPKSISCCGRPLAIGLLSVLSGAVLFAQMGGGMMGSAGSTGGMHGGASQSNGNGQGFGGMMGGWGMNGSGGMMGTAGMGVGAMGNFSVGPDGSAYFVQRTTPTATGQIGQPAQANNDLIALDPQTGATKWKLALTGNRISGPVAAKDGQVFLTIGDSAMWSGVGQTTGSQSAAKLLVVSATGTVLKTTEVESDFVSAPILAGDAPNYVVYVVGYDAGTTGSAGPIEQSERTLYAYYPDGTLKFKAKLGQ